jgi:hypothetical protein
MVLAFNVHVQRLTFFVGILLFTIIFAQQKPDSAKESTSAKPIASPQKQQYGAKYYRSALNALAKSAEKAPKPASDTLKIEARLIEIPGKFPPNDLYNYVYIMKYRIIKMLKGSYTKKDILVGHYNPLVPRDRVKDKMAPMVHGNIKRFEVNTKHMLTLIKPLDRVWNDAVEDNYTDSDLESYFAIEADTLAP